MTPAPCSRGLNSKTADVRRSGDDVREPAADRSAAWSAQAVDSSRRGGPQRGEGDRNDHERGQRRRVAGPAVEVEEEQRRGGERRDRQHRVLEESEAEHARDRLAPVCAAGPKRPVVDREAAAAPRRREHSEAPDDDTGRCPERHVPAVVDPGHVADREHVPPVGHDLADEADHEPGPRMRREHQAKHRRPARVRAQHEDRADRRARPPRARPRAASRRARARRNAPDHAASQLLGAPRRAAQSWLDCMSRRAPNRRRSHLTFGQVGILGRVTPQSLEDVGSLLDVPREPRIWDLAGVSFRAQRVAGPKIGNRPIAK